MQRATRYVIDEQDRLESVGGAWGEFARDNGASHLSADAILGRPLWDFIAGAETRHLYRALIRRVRESGASAVVPFRCDSPSIRRFMMLDVSPGPKGRVEFRGKLIRSEVRKPVRLLDPSTPRSDQSLTICSWCKQLRLPTGVWAETDEAIAAMGLFMSRQLPQLSQSTCPACRARAQAQAKAAFSVGLQT